VRKFSFFVSLHSSHVDTDSSGKVLSVTTECEKFSATADMTSGAVQLDELLGHHVRPTSAPYIFVWGYSML